ALLPPGDDRTVYTEFAAFTLELRFFDPVRLHDCFPAIADWKDVDALLAEDVDAEALFAATRPQGAPAPEVTHSDEDEEEDEYGRATSALGATEGAAQKLRTEADAAAGRGNLVRAALLRARAAPQTDQETLAAAARAELDILTDRLRHALQLTEAQTSALRRALPALLPRAASG